MSRAYRIAVQESLRKVVHAEDHVRTQLDMLDILPCDQMADLLGAELIKQGFERDGDDVVRREGNTVITVDLKAGAVTARSESQRELNLRAKRTARGYEEAESGRAVKQRLKEDLSKELEENASQHREALQRDVTDQLERQLADLRIVLDQAVNRATAEALKQKAAQMGEIKELTEDPETGSLTIVVEV